MKKLKRFANDFNAEVYYNSLDLDHMAKAVAIYEEATGDIIESEDDIPGFIEDECFSIWNDKEEFYKYILSGLSIEELIEHLDSLNLIRKVGNYMFQDLDGIYESSQGCLTDDM